MMSGTDAPQHHLTVTDAIRAARAVQQQEGGGYGVGVQVSDSDSAAFVQWTTAEDDPMIIEKIEIQAAGSGADGELAARGYKPDEELSEYGIVSTVVDEAFSAEPELIEYLASLLDLVGAVDGTPLIAYP